MKMKMVPTSEKHDAIRSVVSSELNWLCVKDGMVSHGSSGVRSQILWFKCVWNSYTGAV